jgi:probable rRNA maturation factor
LRADLADFDILIEDDRWPGALDDSAALALACRRAALAFEPRLAAGATLLLADDATLRDLNLRFRGKDQPTNVLSFPAFPAFPALQPGQAGGDPGFLGDIAIAYETCEREAGALSIAFRDHLAHLIVHGLLHLVGYDHETDDDADRMEQLETRILAAIGAADPYARPPIDDGQGDGGENG